MSKKEDGLSQSKYLIAETDNYKKSLKENEGTKLYKKIKEFIYPQLRNNPFFGPNIKKLKGEFEGVYRYRIGDYRLFYTIDKDNVILFMLDFVRRKNSYKKR